mmetsp:Transcript_11727/g.23888  ORF Transcript_11727/g.23888 Transcript_11727/m.23888 type:complete len:91 (-) Transcript_11727:1392-1664(-)
MLMFEMRTFRTTEMSFTYAGDLQRVRRHLDEDLNHHEFSHSNPRHPACLEIEHREFLTQQRLEDHWARHLKALFSFGLLTQPQVKFLTPL